MLDALKPLIDNGILSESTQQTINEAWEHKLTEAREEIRKEIREEFADRYEHDKEIMEGALDKMVTDALEEEIKEFSQDKRALAEARVAFARPSRDTSKKFNKFLTQKLAEEISEFRKDRNLNQVGIKKLENFVFRALAEEISEFAIDKKKLSATKNKLVSEAKNQLANLKKKFINRSAATINEAVTKQLRTELRQLREDVQTARKSTFGRKIFEAFASEFASTHLNENSEIRRLQSVVEAKNQKLAKVIKAVEKRDAVMENQAREIRKTNAVRQREKLLAEMLDTLAPEKKRTMKTLLEDVQTFKLRSAFEKYLPSVLDNKPVKQALLTESKFEVTGDKTAKANNDDNNIIDIQRLAGLKK